MSFIKDVPNYKNLSSNNYLLNEAPDEIWGKLEAYACKASDDSNTLKAIINNLNELALIPHTQNWGYDWLTNDLCDTLSTIRKKVESGKFPLFMDAIQIIVKHGNIDIDEMNEFLAEEGVGYYLYYESFYREYHWVVRDDIDNLTTKIDETIEVVKSASQQAFEHFEQAKKQLENASSERARKDAVRDCASAMESIIKLLGGENDIRDASKKLRAANQWGKDEIVKDGDSIFNALHRLYPDLRHGSTQASQMTLEEALYWTDRITTYINYMLKTKVILEQEGVTS